LRPNSFGAHADRRPKAFTPIGNRPPQALTRQASASADAKRPSPVGASQPSAKGPWRPNSFGIQSRRFAKGLRTKRSVFQKPLVPDIGPGPHPFSVRIRLGLLGDRFQFRDQATRLMMFLLPLDIGHNSLHIPTADAEGAVEALPLEGQPRSQHIVDKMGGNALQSFDQLGHRDCAGHLNQNVQVVRHAVQSQNCATHFLGFESDHPVQWSLDRRRNEWKSIPCCPDQMDINRNGVPRHDPNPRTAWGRLIMALIRPSRRLKSAFSGAHAPSVGLRRRKGPPPTQRTPSWSAQAFTPIEIGLLRRLRATRRPPPTQRALFRSAQADHRPKASGGRIHSAHMPTAGRRPSRRLEIGLLRRLRATRRPPPTQRALFRSAQADHRPKASGGRIHSAHPAPGVGPRRRKEAFSGRRRPTVGRRPPEVEFIRRAGRPLAESPPGRIHSAHPTPGVGLRRRRECFSVGAGRPLAEGPPRSNSFDGQNRPPGRIHSAHPAPGVGLRQRKERGRRRPTVGRRPFEAEFIRRAGRPSAEGLPRPNSSGAFRRPPNQAPHGAAL
jgi:hypothetical protein